LDRSGGKETKQLVDESIKEYLRHIGAKGGKAVAGTPQAKERAAKAAKARWAKRKQKKKTK
jgi:ribosomal protein L12E/L44/L45/RPP1/RPP2